MSERPRMTEALLLDSEASLRIADRLVRDLDDGACGDLEDPAAGSGPGVLLRAYMEVVSLLQALRRERGTAATTALLDDIDRRLAALVALIERSLPAADEVSPRSTQPAARSAAS